MRHSALRGGRGWQGRQGLQAGRPGRLAGWQACRPGQARQAWAGWPGRLAWQAVFWLRLGRLRRAGLRLCLGRKINYVACTLRLLVLLLASRVCIQFVVFIVALDCVCVCVCVCVLLIYLCIAWVGQIPHGSSTTSSPY